MSLQAVSPMPVCSGDAVQSPSRETVSSPSRETCVHVLNPSSSDAAQAERGCLAQTTIAGNQRALAASQKNTVDDASTRRRGRATLPVPVPKKLAGKRVVVKSKPTIIKKDASDGAVSDRRGVPPAEVRRLYVLSQRIHKAIPTITDAQLREYYAQDSVVRNASHTMFKQLTARATTLSEFAGISLVNDVAIDMHQNEYTEEEQLELLSQLRAKLDVLAARAREEKRNDIKCTNKHVEVGHQ